MQFMHNLKGSYQLKCMCTIEDSYQWSVHVICRGVMAATAQGNGSGPTWLLGTSEEFMMARQAEAEAISSTTHLDSYRGADDDPHSQCSAAA